MSDDRQCDKQGTDFEFSMRKSEVDGIARRPFTDKQPRGQRDEWGGARVPPPKV